MSAPAHMRSTAKPGTVCGQAREERDVAAERQPLVADLGGRGEDDVADPIRRQLRVPAQQLAHRLDGHVVRARLPEVAARPRLAEGGADAVDEDDLAELACHGWRIERRRRSRFDLGALPAPVAWASQPRRRSRIMRPPTTSAIAVQIQMMIPATR